MERLLEYVYLDVLKIWYLENLTPVKTIWAQVANIIFTKNSLSNIKKA